MEEIMERDLTQGPLLKQILSMSIPTMLGYAAQMVYDLVDIYWIGMISSEAVAGVTLFSTIFWIVSALNEIIGSSSVSLISQAYGQKDYEQTKIAIEQTISFKFLMATIAAILIAIFLKPLMLLFSDENVVKHGLDYGYIRLFFLPIMFSSYSVNTAFRCLGESKIPMNIMILVSFLNVFLDAVFMFETIPYTNLKGLNLGVFGAGLATVVSQTISFLIGFIILFTRTHEVKPSIKGLFKLNPKIDKKLLTIGLPNGIEIFFRNLSNMVVLGFVSMFGTAAIAANGIAGRLFGFAFVPLSGLVSGASSVVGQCLGAENLKRAEKASRLAAIVATLIMIIAIFLAFIFGEQVMKVFTNDHEVIKLGTDFLKFGSLGLVALGFGMGLASVFSASGYNFPFLVSSLVSRWGVQFVILVIAIQFLNLSIRWVWLSYMFGDIAESVVFLFFYLRGDWKKKRAW